MTQRASAMAASVDKSARAARRPPLPAARKPIVAAIDEFDLLDAATGGPRRDGSAANDEPPRVPRDAGHFAALATHTAGAAVFDDDALRAQLTRLLLDSMAPRLGLDAKRIVVRADTTARAPLGAHHAVGLQRDGTLFLDPVRYRPDRDSGRYLLAHELAHAAQRFGSGAAAAPEALESEAHRMARALLRKQVVPRPALSLAPGSAAALSASEVETAADVAAALPEEKAIEPRAARKALDELVAQNHPDELARIIELLSYGVFDWAITDSDVTAVLRVLMTVPMVSARALVTALPWKYRRRLLDNLDTVHYKRQREQVLAVWWGCSAAELQPFSDALRKAFEAMDLGRLGPLEAAAAQYALRSMADAQRRQLLDGKRRDAVETLMAFVPDGRDEAAALATALKDEQKLHAERAAAEAAFAGGPRATALKQLVKLIIDIVERRDFRGDDALSVLKMLMPYVQRKAELRAIADHLAGVKVIVADDPKEKPEYEERRDYLEQLIRRVPIRALYASGGLERVFFVLLGFRPPFKNAELAAEKTDDSRFILVDLLMKVLADPFVDRVTSEDAYFAFLLVKAMPASARRAFFDIDQGARWTLVMNKLSQQQRESASLNLFGGDEQAEVGRNTILSQLLADQTWKAEGVTRLDALIRMAIAAGEHRFVFEQSQQREAYAKPWLKPLVDKYRLYDPKAKGADGSPRTHYSREILKGTPWYSGGWLIGGVYTAAQGLDFVFSSDNVELATNSVGGRGLNLVELQDLFGGNFMGARFADRESFAPGTDGASDRGVNFANVKWDTRLGLLTMKAPELQIDAIRYPIDDFLLQTGTANVHGLQIALAYGTNKRAQPTRIDLTIDTLAINDLALIAADRMKSINRVDLGSLQVHAGAPGSGATSPQRPRDGLKVPLPLVGIPLGGAWNLFLGSMWNSLAGLFGAHPKAGVSASATEMADQLLAAKAPMGFRLQIGSVRISGLSTSGGQFIESVQLDDLVLAGGGDAHSYREALNESLARIEQRLAGLRARFGGADATRRDALSLRIRALTQQQQHTLDELKQLELTEAEVKRLETRQKTSPQALSAQDRLRLRRLKAQLGGAVLDVGHVALKGLAGLGSGEFELDDVHGSGRSVDNALGLLTSSDKLRSFVTGAEGRPVLASSVDDADRFTLDIGHAELPTLTIKGAIPSAVQAARDYQRFRAKYEPWRPSHVQELARLAERKTLAAQREALLDDPGLGRLSPQQRKVFKETERRLDELEAQAALTVGKVVLDGAALELSGSEKVAVKAEHLAIDDIRQGGLGIKRIEGNHVEVGVDIGGGIAGFDDWRNNLKKLGIKGESVEAFGIEQQEIGLGVDHAQLLGIDEASLDIGAGAAGVKTKLVLVEGVRLRNSEEMLGRERDYLRRLPQPTPVQQKRLATVSDKLDALQVLRKEVADSVAALAAARTAKQAEAARARRERAQRELDRWAEGLVAGSLAIADLDIGVLGLADVLSPSFDPQAAGLTVSGRGGAGGKRIFSGATGSDLGIPGLSAGTVHLGETGGSVKLTPSGTQIDGVHIDRIDLQALDWRGGQQHAFATGPVELQSIDIQALIGEQHSVISSLDIGAISAEQAGYEDESTGLRVVVESGALGGVHVDNLTISQHKAADGKTKTTVLGDAKIDTLSDLKLDALVGGLRARGTLHGTDLKCEFVTDRKRVFTIGNLRGDSGRITERGTASSIHVSFAGLSGKVTQDTLDDGAMQYQFDNVVLDDFDLGQCRWSGGGWVIQVDADASLRGVSMTASALQAKPTPDGKAGKLRSFAIAEMRVAQIKAHQLHLQHDAVVPDPKKPGDAGEQAKDITLDEATILGLKVRGIDLMKDIAKMTGKVTVHDSIDIQKLRLTLGETGKEQLITTLSTKAYGSEAADPGLRGRELSAELFGPKGKKIQLGTIKEISGDFEGFGAKTAFATGQVTMSPIEFDGVAQEAHVTEVKVQGLTLSAPHYSDGKGTEIKLDSAKATTATIKDVRAKFGELTDDKGNKSQGMTQLAIAGLEFDFIGADGFEYTGKTTLPGSGSKTTTVSARRTELVGLSFDSLSHDFVGHITKFDAKLSKTSITGFALKFADLLSGARSDTEIFGNIEAGAMHAAMTLTGTKTGGKDWTSIDGLFELIDPAHGLGLSNLKVAQSDSAGGKVDIDLLHPRRPGGLDLTGLKVHFAPNGTLYAEFDELAAQNLRYVSGATTVEVPLARLKAAKVAMQGLAPGQAFDVLGATLAELQINGVTATYDKASATPGAGSGAASTDRWVLGALGGLDGTVGLYIVDAKGPIDADISVPIANGVIDFNKTEIEIVGPNANLGVDATGIYIDSIAGRDYKYKRSPLPGAKLERIQYGPRGSRRIVDRGSLDLKVLLEDILNSPPAPASGGGGSDLEILNRATPSGSVGLGTGTIGTTKNNVEISGHAGTKNRITLDGVSLGRDLIVRIPEFQASRGSFEVPGKTGAKSGTTGLIEANVRINIEGLGGTVGFKVKLTVVEGFVRDIKFGDVALTSVAAMRARAAPPKDTSP